MRIPIKAVLALVAVIVVIAYLLLRPTHDEPAPATAPTSGAPTAQEETAPAASTAASEPSEVEVPGVIRKFVKSYAERSTDQDAWGDQLSPYTTPGLYASLLSSDRDLARTAGDQILEAEDQRVSVGSGGTASYTLTYQEIEGEDEGDSTHYVVTAIDYVDPPERAALPLGSNATEQLRPIVQDALTATIAQPGGMSDEDREGAIRDVFSDPHDALHIKRVASSKTSIRVGNAHELVAAEERGQLVVHATAPYAPDGQTAAKWVTVTVSLERDSSGQWQLKDATV
ncbi:hypothetical protein [Brachybacterium kimchii]|uniref:Conjugal transfer protein n=1 Tax=Brachybacterium kimchii TaxID=2942909 RepID=A0ABY4NB94_9MICO|nr:hypothetical protein [Brachybacterium kimchii]UQN31806.1 hypothetical protein M4486_19645 [Brachybacterium kimchii]